MWWLVGLLAALAAASNNDSRNSVVSGSSRSSDSDGWSRTLTYRSRDGSSFFRFRFTPIGGDIRIHILELPNPRVGSCHVLHDAQGLYICWSTAVRSMAAAKAVALMWAEATLIYQRTGRSF
ncbi:MAG: hypothetical protein IT347_01810 [Candidatus Eisenbacteria bacterium]|nr:hypothetical protein [Candidatus Eisenbacteria bacterium]